MTTHDRDKVIAAAKESGIKRTFVCAKPDECPDDDDCCHIQRPDGYWVKDEQLEAFYSIALEVGHQAEREECAKVCEALGTDYKGRFGEDDSLFLASSECADAIRARGTSK